MLCIGAGILTPISILKKKRSPWKAQFYSSSLYSSSFTPHNVIITRGNCLLPFSWSLANSSNICWAVGWGDTGHLIRVTDVKVTSACNKERRNKIKLGRAPFLSEQQQQKTYLKKEGEKVITNWSCLQGAVELVKKTMTFWASSCRNNWSSNFSK